MWIYQQQKRSAQVTMYFLAIVSTLIIVTFITVNIGKIAKDKTHSGNAADAGALAACSAMAAGFNYMADKADADEKRADDQKGKDDTTYGNANELTQSEHDLNVDAQKGNLSSSGTKKNHVISQEQSERAISNNSAYADDINRNNQVSDEARREERDNLHGEQGERNNYYDNALKAGYLYCFYNSGIQQKVSGTQINSRRYQNFLERLQQQKPMNGTPQTFFWVDGAARAHAVTCIVEIEPVDNWEVNNSQDDRATTQNKLNNKSSPQYTEASGHSAAGIGNRIGGMANPCLDPISFSPAAWGNGEAARGAHKRGRQAGRDAQRGIRQQKVEIQKTSANHDQFNFVEDVIHSQTVFVANFQFHMGGPVKGMRGDVDVPTFYPPVQSTAQATFNFNGTGDIHRQGGKGSSPSFECGLVTAW